MRPVRDHDHSSPSSAGVKNSVELYHCSSSGPSRTVLEWDLPLPYRQLTLTFVCLDYLDQQQTPFLRRWWSHFLQTNFPPFIELEILWVLTWPPIEPIKSQLRSVHMYTYSCKTYFNTLLSVHILSGLPSSRVPLCLFFWIECCVHVSYLPSHALRFIHSKRYLSFSSPTPHWTGENELRSRVNTSMGVNFLSGWFNRG